MSKKPATDKYSLVAVLTSFNRKDKTINALKSLDNASNNINLSAILVDDASSDGTAAEVQNCFKWVRVIQGTGNLFWCGGMRIAMATAMDTSPDFILWLNDDTQLLENAIDILIKTVLDKVVDPQRPCIVVGSTCDSEGKLSYGGRKQSSRLFPTRFSLVIPSDEPQSCDAMNGNCVLITRGAYQTLGNLDHRYIHSFGDLDYALRAKKHAIPVWVAPGYIGRCVNDNLATGSFNDVYMPFSKRWRHLLSPKELQPTAWKAFCQAHCGYLWPLVWIWPYIKVVVSSLRPTKASG